MLGNMTFVAALHMEDAMEGEDLRRYVQAMPEFAKRRRRIEKLGYPLYLQIVDSISKIENPDAWA